MSIYIKTNLTKLPKKCQCCRYKEVTNDRYANTDRPYIKCTATVPHMGLNRIDTFKEKHPKCPMKRITPNVLRNKTYEIFDPATGKRIRSMEDLKSYLDRCFKEWMENTVRKIEEGDS